MNAFAAVWFDGRTAAGMDAEVVVGDDVLRARAGADEFEAPMKAVRVSAPIAGVPLRLGLPNGGLLVLKDAAIDTRVFGVRDPEAFVHRLERNAIAVVIAVLAVGVLATLAYRAGIPWL